MAFDTLEYLEQGKVDFVYHLTVYDYKYLIRNVRASERKNEIIKGFLPLLINKKPDFCFDIIFDNDMFLEEAKYLLERFFTYKSFDKDDFEMFLNSKLAPKFLEENFDNILEEFINDLDFIFAYLFKNKDSMMHLLRNLAYHPNLHIRYLFMKYMLLNHPEDISLFYSDITKYLTSETFQENEQLSLFKDYMDVKDASDLAFIAFDKVSADMWEKFKDYILSNYEYNDLAKKLLEYIKVPISSGLFTRKKNEKGIPEFAKDADILFSTALRSRFYIFKKFSSYVSQELLEQYQNSQKYFFNDGEVPFVYEKLDSLGLSRRLDLFVEKYMDLSTDKSYEFLDKGSTATCYRIGDFVFKLVSAKWSYEDIICPDLYIILPNLEEELLRDENGIVYGGIEVQKFLKRSASNIPKNIESEFNSELARLGYYVRDILLRASHDDNCRLLDSYLDSGNPNPPDWFIEYPMVLVDRDRVYSIDNESPKQLRISMS